MTQPTNRELSSGIADLSGRVGALRVYIDDLSIRSSYDVAGSDQIVSLDSTTTSTINTMAGVVPTLQLGDSVVSTQYVADRYYAYVGSFSSTTAVPQWLNTSGSGTYQQWDTTAKAFYVNGTEFFGGAQSLAYPLGVAGAARTHSPKNTVVTTFILEFGARFPQNSNYAGKGIGLSTETTSGDFSSASRNIQVARNVANWELSTSDATTRTTTAVAGADGSFHDFKVVWSATDVKLYVDGVLVITKTTNLPDRPLKVFTNQSPGLLDTDIIDLMMRWA